MITPTWVTRAITVSAGGATLASVSGGGAAYARQEFDASGNVVLSATLNGDAVFLGLIPQPTLPADAAYSELTHSLYLFYGALYVFESGVNITNTACADLTAISITVNAGTVTYQKAGVTFYTSGVAASGNQVACVLPNGSLAGKGFTSLALTGLPVTTYPITLSASTVAPGGTVTATMTPVDLVAITIDGATISGTPTTIVTGASGGALTGPSAAIPTIANLPSRAQTIIGYQESAMRIYLPSTRPSTWTLQRSSDGLTGWATDATQGTNPINDSGLTYTGAVAGTDYATNHGWTLSASYYYALLPTYSDGSIGQRSNVIRPSAAADYECSVSGQMPLLADGTCEWSGQTGSVVLSEAVTLGGRTYLTTGYEFTIASNGTWSVSVPRLAAASQADGGSSTLLASFRFPDGSRIAKVVPNSASAAFSALTAG